MRQLVFWGLALIARPQSFQDKVAGVWRGESICAQRGTACVDERVVYDIRVNTEHEGFVTIRADKIVDGHAVTMGTVEWRCDPDNNALVWDTPRQTWLMKVEGDTIDGTLTLADRTLIRRMTLKRSKSQ